MHDVTMATSLPTLLKRKVKTIFALFRDLNYDTTYFTIDLLLSPMPIQVFSHMICMFPKSI